MRKYVKKQKSKEMLLKIWKKNILANLNHFVDSKIKNVAVMPTWFERVCRHYNCSVHTTRFGITFFHNKSHSEEVNNYNHQIWINISLLEFYCHLYYRWYWRQQSFFLFQIHMQYAFPKHCRKLFFTSNWLPDVVLFALAIYVQGMS